MISTEKAAAYVDQAYSWLEGFGKGFDKNDWETWKPENLPAFSKYVLHLALKVLRLRRSGFPAVKVKVVEVGYVDADGTSQGRPVQSSWIRTRAVRLGYSE